MGKFEWATGRRAGLAVVLSASLALASCAPLYENHGYVPQPDELENIIVGADTKETVSNVIGNPGALGLLDDSGWYYVESRFRTVGFLAPQEIDRKVVVISFDRSSRVANIERFGLENGRVIRLSRRVTKSSTVKSSFLRQLFGAVGRIGGGLFN